MLVSARRGVALLAAAMVVWTILRNARRETRLFQRPAERPIDDNDAAQPAEPRQTNILLIVVDDLRLFDSEPYPYMPHLTKLKAQATTFLAAHAQIPHCAPSRASFMTGRRPDETRVYNFVDDFRHTGAQDQKDWETLPGFFRRNGYYVSGGGKLFNSEPHNRPPDNDMPHSFEKYFFKNSNVNTDTEIACGACRKFQLHDRSCARPVPWQKLPADGLAKYMQCLDVDDDDSVYFDMVLADAAAKEIASAASQTRPFFIGVGFHRPHTPWVVPRSLYRSYREGTAAAPFPSTFAVEGAPFPNLAPMSGPPSPQIPLGAPRDAFISCFPKTDPRKIAPLLAPRVMRAAYYAASTLVDRAIGRVLEALRQHHLESTTAVVLISDHGFLLGEHGQWCKRSLFDASLRVPMVIKAPGRDGGIAVDDPVDIVDVYKTLASVTGLESRLQPSVGGSDLSAYLTRRDPPRAKAAAFSQMPRCDAAGSVHAVPGCALKPVSAIASMGYTVRTKMHRYTAWLPFENGNADWEAASAPEELYEYSDGNPSATSEEKNLAPVPSMSAVKAELRALLEAHFRRPLRAFDFAANFRPQPWMPPEYHRCFAFSKQKCERKKRGKHGGGNACKWSSADTMCVPDYFADNY